jgi:lipopolysaccharide/colanic/teichoic acid biosynthesis glycosyltransferase
MEMIDELQKRYSSSSRLNRFRFLKKKYAWLFVVKGSVFVKRLMDVSVALTMMILLMPLLLLVAAAIKLSDFGPIFFNQIRIGKHGREFKAYKFRSMVINADKQVEAVVGMSHHVNSISYKVKKDPRVTWIGRIIRKTSIDELPQLWNVINGDMSLVGPRPHVHREVDQYTLDDRKRLDVTPGITCIWQISGRADIAFPEQLQLDLEYIRSQSFWNDIKILLKTIPAVISGKGAY